MTLLLLPGFMTDEALWDEMAGPLRAAGPLVRGDLRAGGSIESLARDVLAQTPSRFSVIGFSMGGYVARELARVAPERVSGLVLVATSARADTAEQTRRKRDSVARLVDAPFRGFNPSAVRASVHPDRAHDDVLIDAILAMGSRLGGAVFARQSGMAREGDLARLGAIHCPTLIVAAAQDSLRSFAESRELAAGISGATMSVIQGSGHMLPLEAPDRLSALILDWLGEQGLLPESGLD